MEETLRTLALILPEGDKKCQKWFETKKKKSNLDPKLESVGIPIQRSVKSTSFGIGMIALLF